MKKFEKHQELKTVTTLIERTCDLCQRFMESDNKTTASYIIDETLIKITVTQQNGTSTPDGGEGTAYEIDLCPFCFKNKLVPWLKGNGATIEERKWDW